MILPYYFARLLIMHDAIYRKIKVIKIKLKDIVQKYAQYFQSDYIAQIFCATGILGVT